MPRKAKASQPPSEAPSKPQSAGGRKPGATGYSAADVAQLLNIVKEVKPVGSDMWQSVADKYAIYAFNHHRQLRESDHLKKKFNALVNHKKKTGDPDCPSDVREAKRIWRVIEGEIGVGDMGADNEPSEQEEGEEDDGDRIDPDTEPDSLPELPEGYQIDPRDAKPFGSSPQSPQEAASPSTPFGGATGQPNHSSSSPSLSQHSANLQLMPPPTVPRGAIPLSSQVHYHHTLRCYVG